MRAKVFICVILLAFVFSLGIRQVKAGGGGTQGMVINVVDQFQKLAQHGDPMAFRLGVGENPSLYRHYQGVVRVNGPDGTPYFILSRSDCPTPAGGGTYFEPGELLVVRMGSREKDGERLRSNILGGPHMTDTWPPAEDIGVVNHNTFVNDNNVTVPVSHPGGMQVVGDVLVVAMEEYCYGDPCCDVCSHESQKRGGVALYDVSDPEAISLLYHENFYHTDGWGGDTGLGVIGAAYVYPDEHPVYGDRYLFVLAWGSSDDVRFAVSNTNDLHTTTDLELLPYVWNENDTSNWRDWQMLNFVRDTNGSLYLIGAEKDISPPPPEDYIALFKVDVSKLNDQDNASGIFSYVSQKHLQLGQGGTGDPQMGSLDAASGIYVSPTGNMILYTGPHDNDHVGGTVEMGEFRNREVYSPETEAYETMCPWIELYEDERGWDDEHDSPDVSYILDYKDKFLEAWIVLDAEEFGDEADSLGVYLKPGQKLHLFEDEGWSYGDSVYVLIGDGQVYFYPSLDDWGWGDEIDSVKMFPFADPGGPYTGPYCSAVPLDGADACLPATNSTVSFEWEIFDDGGLPAPCDFSPGETSPQPSVTCDHPGAYELKLTVTESNPFYFFYNEEAEAVTDINLINYAPTVLELAPASVEENKSIGTLIGNFTTSDPNDCDTFTYTLEDNAAYPDNSLFTISGNQLLTNDTFNFEYRDSYTINVRTTDNGGMTFEQNFTIEVIDLEDGFGVGSTGGEFSCGPWLVSFPPGAVPDGYTLRCEPRALTDAHQSDKVELFDRAWEFNVYDERDRLANTFNLPVKICTSPSKSEIISAGVVSNLVIFSAPPGGIWRGLPSFWNELMICVEVNHFSMFTLGYPHLPETGFSPGQVTSLATQPEEKQYIDLGNLWLEIPGLDLQLPIVGVTIATDGWDVRWLGRNAGYLEGTAFPTTTGNTGITAHVWDANNNPGPFANLKTLQYGNVVKIHAWGYVYTYAVRYNYLTTPDNTTPLRHEDYDWVTLLTCERFSPTYETYRFRRVVRAVLVDVSPE